MINNIFTIDAHCHIYPEKIASRAVAGTDAFYGEKSLCKGTAFDLINEGKKAGIDHFIVQSVATTPHQVRSINEFIAKEVTEAGGLMTGLGTLHPDSEDIKGDIKHIIELGLHGVKLHPDIQKFKIDDYRCLKIYDLCEQENIPILMHTGDSRFDFSNPNRLLPIMEIYTSLTVVGAHLGGWSVWDEAVSTLKDLPNFYVDCSSCFPFIDAKKVKELIKQYGAEKVLFGTDYPMWSPSREIEEFLALGLDEFENKCILNMNAKKVFNLE
jgi:predicted TIM-barrel fold metal-dependent hydrolase